MSRFEITPEDVGRSVQFRNGKQGKIAGFQPYKSRPVVVLDQDLDRSCHTVDGSLLGFECESDWDIIAVYGPQTATEQPISFDSGYVQKKLGEYFSGLSLQQTDSVRPKDLRDEFAMAVVSSIQQVMYPVGSRKEIAKRAYEIADAMMEAREGKV